MFSKPILALDIRGQVIKAIEGNLIDDNTVKINRAAYLDLSTIIGDKESLARCYEAGRLINSEDTVNCIVKFLKRNKFTSKRVILNITDEKVVVRVMQLPRLSLSDIEGLIEMESHKYFPVDLSKYVVDFKVLGTVNKEGKEYYKILACAMPKSIIREYTEILLSCGLKPIAIDIHSNAISRLYKNLEFEDVAILDLDMHQADLLMLDRGNYFINTTFSCEFMNRVLSSDDGTESDTTILDSKLKELIQNVQNYFKFYLSKNEGKSIDSIYLTGEFSLIKGFEKLIKEELKINVFSGLDKSIKILKSKKASGIDENFYCGNIGAMLRGE